MKLARDLAVIGITAILAAPFARLHPAHADGEESAPTLRPAGVDLDGVAVTIDGHAVKGGTAEAKATLTAVNRRDTSVERKVRVLLNVTPPVNQMSRMVLPLREKWSREITLKLAAGETRKVELRTGTSIGAHEIATFSIGKRHEISLNRNR